VSLAVKSLGSGLTVRETQILQLASTGSTDGQISVRLGISIHTVRDYWRHAIKPALGAQDRTNAVALAVAMGLVNPLKEEVPC
jgi:DNA-binding CsgD family transcriptional regulator